MSELEEYFERVLHGPPFKSGEEMRYELLRLASFHAWPDWAVKRACCLAENGFYYSGSGDLVCCHACGGQIQNWSTEDDVAARHRNLSPDCSFIRASVARDDNITRKAPDVRVADPESTRETNAIGELLKQIQSLDTASGSEQRRHRQTSRSVEAASGRSEMRNESSRLATYIDQWPHGSPSPENLAKAGFYYRGPGDRVECAFCGGQLEAWNATDDVFVEHRKRYPTCSFASSVQSNDLYDNRKQLSPVQREADKKQSVSEVFGVITDKPKYPEYTTELSRLDTFSRWPKKLVIRPIELAKAGFFYVGYADDVKCFYCAGSIRHWQGSADPWQLHARWFSKCAFLKLSKGDEYISKVLQQYSAKLKEEDNVRATSSINDQNGVKWIAQESGAMADSSEQIKDNINCHMKKKKNRKRKNKTLDTNIKSSDDTKHDNKDKDEEVKEEMIRLRDEFHHLQQEQQCKVCLTEKCNIVFLPCGHIVCCPSCAAALKKCPICRNNIKASVRAYFP